MPVVLAAPRIPGSSKGTYSQIVDVDGVRYGVVLRLGKRVRIPYKRRGENIGYRIEGLVYQGGRCVWSGTVDRGTGVKRMLHYAGLVDAKGRTPLDAQAHFRTRSREWLTRSTRSRP